MTRLPKRRESSEYAPGPSIPKAAVLTLEMSRLNRCWSPDLKAKPSSIRQVIAEAYGVASPRHRAIAGKAIVKKAQKELADGERATTFTRTAAMEQRRMANAIPAIPVGNMEKSLCMFEC